MKSVTLLFGLLLSLTCLGQKTIKGIVYDKKGPISGATVTELGTEKEFQTNEQGEFELTLVTNDQTLLIAAYDHCVKTIKIKDDKFLKVKLKRCKQRDIAMIDDKDPDFRRGWVWARTQLRKPSHFSCINVVESTDSNNPRIQ